MQSKALRVKVKAFLPNPQGCSKILQLEPTGMTCAVWAFKGLIPPTLVSHPEKVMFGGCSASRCSCAVATPWEEFRSNRMCSWITLEFCLAKSPFHASE